MSIISFTKNGALLSKKIAEKMKEGYAQDGQNVITWEKVFLYTKCSIYQENHDPWVLEFVEKSIGEWAGEQMELRNALLFIGACGIAVRAIAPHIVDKLHDSPVLVMDEKGTYIIPVLSGHMGGANELAAKISETMGSVPVITTATDLHGKFAVDLFAKRNGCCIMERAGIAKVSAKILAGKELLISVESGHMDETESFPEGIKIVPYPPMQPVDILVATENTASVSCLYLMPREYIIGMGCRKGKEASCIELLVQKSLEEAGISLDQVFALASIDRKKEEAGLLLWSRKAGIPFYTFSVEQLQETEGDFHASDFVKEQMGVDDVCERAALKACGMNGTLIYEKHAEDGMTIAIAKREWRVSFDGE